MLLFNYQRSQDNHHQDNDHLPSQVRPNINTCTNFKILKTNISLIQEMIVSENLKLQAHLFLHLEKFRFAKRSMHKTSSPEISQRNDLLQPSLLHGSLSHHQDSGHNRIPRI